MGILNVRTDKRLKHEACRAFEDPQRYDQDGGPLNRRVRATMVGKGVHHNVLEVTYFTIQDLELSFGLGKRSQTHENFVPQN